MMNGVAAMNNPTENEQREMNPVVRGLYLFLLFNIGVFSIGFLHGHLEHGHASLPGLIVPIIAILGATWGIFHLLRPLFKRTKNNAPIWSTRTGRTRLMWTILAPLGFITGIALSVYDIDIFNPESVNAAPTPAIAIGAAIVGTILIFAFDRFYRRNVDEMELNAVFEASYWTINFYIVAMPVGWLLWKANLVADMPSWAIFWIAILIYNAVFLWKKFR